MDLVETQSPPGGNSRRRIRSAPGRLRASVVLGALRRAWYRNRAQGLEGATIVCALCYYFGRSRRATSILIVALHHSPRRGEGRPPPRRCTLPQ